MNLKHLNDECLLLDTRSLVQRERDLLTQILHHFREIERRRLFSGHSSLFIYAVGELKYSKDQAYRRIAAMRLLTELPEIEPKIESGEINLTHVGIADALFKNERKEGRPLTSDSKVEVFESMVGTSSREAEAIAKSFSGEPAPKTPDSIRPLGHGRNLLTTEISDEALALFDQLKGRFAHQDPNPSMGELMKRGRIGLEASQPGPRTRAKNQARIKSQHSPPDLAAGRPRLRAPQVDVRGTRRSHRAEVHGR